MFKIQNNEHIQEVKRSTFIHYIVLLKMDILYNYETDKRVYNCASSWSN